MVSRTQVLLNKYLQSDEQQPQTYTLPNSCDRLSFLPSQHPSAFFSASPSIFLWLQSQLISIFYPLTTENRAGLETQTDPMGLNSNFHWNY